MKLTVLNQQIYSKLYSDIIEFRTAFDLPVENPESLDDAADALHTSLITEELTEMADSKTIIQVIDSITDSLYVLMGRSCQMGQKRFDENMAVSYLMDLLLCIAKNKGFDALMAWDIVHKSNMSKLCRNEQEYNDTVDFYAKKNVEIYATQKGGFIVAKCAADTIMNGSPVKKNKVLKSVNYAPADLMPVVEAMIK